MSSNKLSLQLWTTATLAALVLVMALVAADPASAQTTDGGDVTVDATNQSTLTLDLSKTAADFGSLNPTGSTSSSGATATSNPSGAFYRISDATTATVNSNLAWSGSVAAVASTGGSNIPLSALQWQLGGMDEAGAGATSFGTTADPSAFTTASTGTAGGTGTSTYAFGYGLDVLYTNTPGTFATTVTYNASQS